MLELASGDDNCDIICYADDTLIIVTAKNLIHTQLSASVIVTRVIDQISRLGLSVAAEKTEAMLFHKKGAVDLPSSIIIRDTVVNFANCI